MPTYPPRSRIRSVTELHEHYDRARSEILAYRRTARIESKNAAMSRKDLRGVKQENTKLKKHMLTITRKKKAAEEASKAGYWSGGATVAVTILYEVWRIVGFPGGHRFSSVWEHEAVYGAICWTMTMIFALAYRATQQHDD